MEILTTANKKENVIPDKTVSFLHVMKIFSVMFCGAVPPPPGEGGGGGQTTIWTENFVSHNGMKVVRKCKRRVA